MKKLLLLSLGLISGLACNAAVFSTNIVASSTTPGFLLLSGGMKIQQIQMTAPANATVVLYDNSSMAVPIYGTNDVIPAYTSRTNYATNYVTSYVGYNGVTNWYTNAGVWSADVSVGRATNTASPAGVWVVSGNTYATYNTDIQLSKGAVVTVNTNTSLVIYYTRP